MKKNRKKKHKQKSCVFSDYLICKSFQFYYHNLIRLALPSGKNYQRCNWTSTKYQSHLTRQNTQWYKKNDFLLRQLTPMSNAAELPQPLH
jgi:hypothetical protein